MPPPETEIEMYLDPEGWRIVEPKPFIVNYEEPNFDYHPIKEVDEVLKSLVN